MSASFGAAGAVADLGRALHARLTASPRWLTLGGVVLAVTGAEALYADRGHFGATPIRMTWFAIVFPAVLLNYLGQGALILSDHKAISNPFYLVAPHWAAAAARVPGDRGDDHRLPGGADRIVLGRQAGGAARLHAATADRPHVRARGSDLRADHQLAAVRRRRRAGAGVPQLQQAVGHLRRRGDRHVHPRHDAVRRGRAIAVAHAEVAAAPDGRGCSTSSRCRSSPRT